MYKKSQIAELFKDQIFYHKEMISYLAINRYETACSMASEALKSSNKIEDIIGKNSFEHFQNKISSRMQEHGFDCFTIIEKIENNEINMANYFVDKIEKIGLSVMNEMTLLITD